MVQYSYVLTYNVSDTAGNAAVEVIRTVNVTNATEESVIWTDLVGVTATGNSLIKTAETEKWLTCQITINEILEMLKALHPNDIQRTM